MERLKDNYKVFCPFLKRIEMSLSNYSVSAGQFA